MHCRLTMIDYFSIVDPDLLIRNCQNTLGNGNEEKSGLMCRERSFIFHAPCIQFIPVERVPETRKTNAWKILLEEIVHIGGKPPFLCKQVEVVNG